ncbi:MAG: hypothetical protein LUH82_03775 [Clostridiales bacterium]|nr:hypothetical protein [Clostridiales bacterium]
MITSELREYCQGIISYYAADYPYYFMCTDTTVSNNAYSQTGAIIYLSSTEPVVNSQFSMTADNWLVINVLSANANYNNHDERVAISTSSGTVSCAEFEYVYSNISSDYCYSVVETFDSVQQTQLTTFNNVFAVIICACLISVVVSIWLKR